MAPCDIILVSQFLDSEAYSKPDRDAEDEAVAERANLLNLAVGAYLLNLAAGGLHHRSDRLERCSQGVIFFPERLVFHLKQRQSCASVHVVRRVSVLGVDSRQ